MQYTAQELIDHAKAYLRADAERMSKRPAGVTRSAWRQEHPVGLPHSFDAVDTALKTRPRRLLSFDLNGNPYDLWVWSTGRRPDVIERIDLRSPEADEQLARYAKP